MVSSAIGEKCLFVARRNEPAQRATLGVNHAQPSDILRHGVPFPLENRGSPVNRLIREKLRLLSPPDVAGSIVIAVVEGVVLAARVD